MFEAMHDGKQMRDLDPIWRFLLFKYFVEPCISRRMFLFLLTFLLLHFPGQ